MDKWVKAKGVEGIVNGMDVEEWSPVLVRAGCAGAEGLRAGCGGGGWLAAAP